MINANDIYENIGNIEDKCSELISEINQHLSVKEIDVTEESKKKIQIHDQAHENVIKKSNVTKLKAQPNEKKCADKMFLKCHQTIVNVFCNREQFSKSNDSVERIKDIYLCREICSKITKINQLIDERSIFKVRETILHPEIEECNVHAVSTKKRLDIQNLHHITIKPPLIKQVAFSLNLQAKKQHAGKLENVATFECVHNSPSRHSDIETNEIAAEDVATAEYCTRYSNEKHGFGGRGKKDKSDKNHKVALNKDKDERSNNFASKTQTDLNENRIEDHLRSFLFGNLKKGKVPRKRSHLNSAAVSIKAKRKGYGKSVTFKAGEFISRSGIANEYSKSRECNIVNRGIDKINEELLSKNLPEVNNVRDNCLLDSNVHTYSADNIENNANKKDKKTNIGIQNDYCTFSDSSHVLINNTENELTQTTPAGAIRDSESNRIHDPIIMQKGKHQNLNYAMKTESEDKKISSNLGKEIRDSEYLTIKTDADIKNNEFIRHHSENTEKFDETMIEKNQKQNLGICSLPSTINNKNLLSSPVLRNENKFGNISNSMLNNFTDYEKHVKMLLDIINDKNPVRNPEKQFGNILVPKSNISSSLFEGPPSPLHLNKTEIHLNDIQTNTVDVNGTKLVFSSGISPLSKRIVNNEKYSNLRTSKPSSTTSNSSVSKNALLVTKSNISSLSVNRSPSSLRPSYKIENRLNKIQTDTVDTKMKLVDSGISPSLNCIMKNEKDFNSISPKLSSTVSESLMHIKNTLAMTSIISSPSVKKSPSSLRFGYKTENQLNEIQADTIDNKTKLVSGLDISPSSDRILKSEKCFHSFTPKLNSTTSDSLMQENALYVTSNISSSSPVKRSPSSLRSSYKIENQLNKIQTDTVNINKTKLVGDSDISSSSNRIMKTEKHFNLLSSKLSSTTSSNSSQTPNTCSLSFGELISQPLSPGEIIIADEKVTIFPDSFFSSSSCNVSSEGEIDIAGGGKADTKISP